MVAALVAAPVVTLTSTVPVAAPGGLVTPINPSASTKKPEAETPPKVTSVAPVKPVPTMLSGVPPCTGPWLGETPNTAGVDGLA